MMWYYGNSTSAKEQNDCSLDVIALINCINKVGYQIKDFTDKIIPTL